MNSQPAEEKKDNLPAMALKALIMAVLGYALLYTIDGYTRHRKGGWDVTFNVEANGTPSVTINQPKLGLQNIRVVFVGEKATNAPRHIIFNRTEMPVPFGRIRFQDLTYLPGTLTFDFFGHEVELLPRVLSINLQEYDWQSGTTYYLTATNKIPGLKDRDRKGRR